MAFLILKVSDIFFCYFIKLNILFFIDFKVKDTALEEEMVHFLKLSPSKPEIFPKDTKFLMRILTEQDAVLNSQKGTISPNEMLIWRNEFDSLFASENNNIDSTFHCISIYKPSQDFVKTIFLKQSESIIYSILVSFFFTFFFSFLLNHLKIYLYIL